MQPILSVLNRQNPSTPFVTSPTKNGVYDTSSSQTIYLWVDVKTDGPTTFPSVIRELEPLRSAGYLTNVSADGQTVSAGPVTVIGTGNTPLSQVQPVAPRDYFYDAPLQLLNSTFSNITSTVSPIASVDFATAIGTVPRNGTFTEAQMEVLNQQVQTARERGIGARYWDTPTFPVYVRNRIWGQLWEAGVELINVDDLVAGAGLADFANYYTT